MRECKNVVHVIISSTRWDLLDVGDYSFDAVASRVDACDIKEGRVSLIAARGGVCCVCVCVLCGVGLVSYFWTCVLVVVLNQNYS